MSLRVEVDRVACTGHGRCYVLAPEVFEPDDDGYCIVPVVIVSAERAEAARRGVMNCPEEAIAVVESGEDRE